jgi:peptidoglycan/LPS O-acetylase OafA/YrhL
MLVTAIAAFRSVCFRQFVRLPWIAAIGGMCYTIYLYHYLVISLVGRLTLPRIQSGGLGLALGLEIIFILPVILAACGVLFVLFERPFMSRTWVERFRAQVLRTKSTEPLAQSTS